MRRWYFRFKEYQFDACTLYSIEESDAVYVHVDKHARTSLCDKSYVITQMYPMTLSWILNNYPHTKGHVPITTYKQILEDLAHATR